MNKAFESAKAKGREAGRTGAPQVPPYLDERTTRGAVTFSRAFIRAWLAGYKEGKIGDLTERGSAQSGKLSAGASPCGSGSQVTANSGGKNA